jgi:CRISPR system Cascade subunit CasB
MTKTHPFITYLEGLRDDRGALAALRRGLGQPPGTVADMYRYVVPWLSDDARPWREDAYYLIAALFAYHPMEGGTGNLGDHFACAREPRGDNTAIERRFTALLAAHPDDLPSYLRQAVSFLKSKVVPINWHQLLSDVMAWSHPDLRDRVQKDWARAFWGRPARETQNT